MERAQNCWYDITDTTISNCFRKSGIISPRQSDGSINPAKLNDIQDINLGADPIIDPSAQKDLEQDLEELISMKIVHQKNMMSISELLNPRKEHASGLEIWTPEEIFQEITQRNNQVNSPAPEDCEVEVPPKPAYSDFIKAADVVLNYVRDEGSEEANTCARALRQALRACSASHSKSLIQTTLSSLFLDKMK